MGGGVGRVRGLAARNLLVRQGGQLFAAGFHLNGNVLQRGAAEIQARRLIMIRAPHVSKLTERLFFKLLNVHKSILALNCFYTMTPRVA